MSEAERLRDTVWRSRWSDLREPLETLAVERGLRVFLIGGYVRDLLLGRQPRDLDLTVEGDGLEFAAALGRRLGGAVHKADRFLTAEIDLPDGRRVDVASTRSETYARPGALPRVRPAGLATDLERRDFSVNTFALCLVGDATCELQCVAGAREDLAARRLRPLHSRSFVDDPTRILRALGQEVRLGFRLTEEGERELCRAVGAGALGTVSGERLWSELEPLLASMDPTAPALLRRAEELGVLDGLLPGLGWSARQESLLARGGDELEVEFRAAMHEAAVEPEANRAECQQRVQVALLVLASSPDAYLGGELAERLRLPGSYRSVLQSWAVRAGAARGVLADREAAASTVHRALRALSIAELAFLAASTDERGRDWVRRELREMRRLELRVRAADLLGRGASPGPGIGRALERTLAARLDGVIGIEDELDYALEVLRQQKPRETR